MDLSIAPLHRLPEELLQLALSAIDELRDLQYPSLDTYFSDLDAQKFALWSSLLRMIQTTGCAGDVVKELKESRSQVRVVSA